MYHTCHVYEYEVDFLILYCRCPFHCLLRQRPSNDSKWRQGALLAGCFRVAVLLHLLMLWHTTARRSLGVNSVARRGKAVKRLLPDYRQIHFSMIFQNASNVNASHSIFVDGGANVHQTIINKTILASSARQPSHPLCRATDDQRRWGGGQCIFPTQNDIQASF
jgi:hypothetical protein